MSCIDDHAALELVEGRLSGEALARAEAHLDGCDGCTALVSALAGGAPPPSPGDQVGRFTIVGCVGRGAMGVVYLARDPTLDRDVALKVLRPLAGGALQREDGRADLEERMVAEAKAMAKLAHPNVATVFEVGRDERGVYLAMEYVRGSTLRGWLASGHRTEREIRDVFDQAGRGLAAAHEAGLVHRDFKPENVLVGADGRARVTDFGLACLARESAGEAGEADGFGADVGSAERPVRAGTPAYMSPEQLDDRDATARSDQFTFAVCLFEALVGTRPFAGATRAELRAAMVDQRPGGVSTGGRAIPGRVRAALTRALAVDPAQRFESLDALLAALRERPRRLPVAIGVAAGAALIALAVVVGVVGLRRAPEPASTARPDVCAAGVGRMEPVWSRRSRTDLREAFARTGVEIQGDVAERVVEALDAYARRWVDAHRDTCEATAVRHEQSDAALDARMRCLDRRLGALDALTTTLTRPDASVVIGATAAALELPSVEACASLESLQAEDARPTDPEVVAAMEAIERRADAVGAAGATGRFEGALPEARSVVVDARGVGHRPLVARVALAAARIARGAGAFGEAAAFAKEAEVAAVAARADGVAAEVAIENLAVDGARGRPKEVLDGADRALAAIMRVGSPAALVAALPMQLGLAKTALGDLGGARESLADALERTEKAWGAESLAAARVQTALGDVARLRGDLDGALGLHRRAMAIDEALLGKNHPGVARHHHNIAGVRRLRGEREEALKEYGVALALEKIAGEKSPAVGLTENSVSIALLELGRVEEARKHVDVAVEILGAAKHPDLALALANRATAWGLGGKHREAIEDLGKAIELATAAVGAEHLRVAGLREQRGMELRAVGQEAEGRKELGSAMRIAGLHREESAEAGVMVGRIEKALVPVAGKKLEGAKPRTLGGQTYGSAPGWGQ